MVDYARKHPDKELIDASIDYAYRMPWSFRGRLLQDYYWITMLERRIYKLKRQLQESSLKNIPSSLGVITDGEGDYPDEAEAGNIPVLWLITGERKAPWGRYVRIDK